MKTLRLVDPSKALRAAALEVIEDREVTTCRSSTCNHSSHDPYYRRFVATFADELPIRFRPGNAHSHAWAKLESELMADDLVENGGDWFELTGHMIGRPDCE